MLQSTANPGEPKKQFVRDLVARLTEQFPDAMFGWDDDFDDGIFYVEMYRGNATYVLEHSPRRGFGTAFYVDDGEDNLGSYRCNYFESFDAAFANFLTLTETILPDHIKP